VATIRASGIPSRILAPLRHGGQPGAGLLSRTTERAISSVIVDGARKCYSGGNFPRFVSSSRSGIGGQMRRPDRNLNICLLLMTGGVARFLVGIGWVMVLGSVLLLLASAFSSHPKKPSIGVVVAAALVIIAIWVWDNPEALNNRRDPLPVATQVLFVLGWAFAGILELRCWRRNRSSPHDP
jgi:hypothetical protein